MPTNRSRGQPKPPKKLSVPLTLQETVLTFLRDRFPILQKSIIQKQFQGRQGLQFVIIISAQLMMSNEVKQDWVQQLSDLQSYSFDGCLYQNQYPIHDNPPYQIELSMDPLPFHHSQCLDNAKMETKQSYHMSFGQKDGDYFYFEQSLSGAKQKEDTLHEGFSSEQKEQKKDSPQENKEKKIKKAKKCNNSKKNQYDKNIFANITSVIVKKMLNPNSEFEVRYYCEMKQVSFEIFYNYFASLQRSKHRLGTTELSNFYANPQFTNSFKEVFSMFMVRYLNEDYLHYILREGKMVEKQKYLRCATKMMYIPRLRKEEYHIISDLMTKV